MWFRQNRVPRIGALLANYGRRCCVWVQTPSRQAAFTGHVNAAAFGKNHSSSATVTMDSGVGDWLPQAPARLRHW